MRQAILTAVFTILPAAMILLTPECAAQSAIDDCEAPSTGFEQNWLNPLNDNFAGFSASTDQAQAGSQSVASTIPDVTRSFSTIDPEGVGLSSFTSFTGWFYDTMVPSASEGHTSGAVDGRVAGIGCNAGTGGDHRYLGIAVDGVAAPGTYFVNSLSPTFQDNGAVLTGPSRSLGWHKAEFIQIGGDVEVKLDDASLGIVENAVMNDCWLLDEIDDGGTSNGSNPDVYFDSFTWTGQILAGVDIWELQR
jgi:hypothetical protein